MLLSKKTIKEFGYNPRDLSKGSDRRIWVRCPICKTEKTIPRNRYHNKWICINCSQSRRRIDLIGKRFGRLVCIERKEPVYNKKGIADYMWLCECDCGNKKIIAGHSLKRGITKSCGCLQKEIIKEINKKPLAVGTRFGRLTVLKENGRHKQGAVLYLCRCDCGNETTVVSTSLRNGHTKSCGCLHRELANKRASTLTLRLIPSGTRFGRLIVLERKGSKRGYAYYRCKCDCGTITFVNSYDLRSGSTRSCGCLSKEQKTKHGLWGTPVYWQYYNRKRREFKKLYDNNWTLEMERFLKWLQPTCVVCNGIEVLTVDHVRALSKSNKNGLEPGNAVILCRKCNSRKGNKDLNELPNDVAEKISEAAQQFKNFWECNL